MKNRFIPIAILFLIACNNDSGQAGHTQDSSGHTMQQEGENAAMNQSFMGLMQKNMNDMKAVPSTGDPDNDFAALMKIHHQGALEMARLELEKGNDESIKAIAQKMVDEQQKEIAQLDSFIASHPPKGGDNTFHTSVLNQMNSMNMMDHSGSTDKQFLEVMIQHHQGAIDMSNAYLQSGKDEKLKAVARKTIADQQKEIAEMKAKL